MKSSVVFRLKLVWLRFVDRQVCFADEESVPEVEQGLSCPAVTLVSPQHGFALATCSKAALRLLGDKAECRQYQSVELFQDSQGVG